jgi:hypothetical protein
MMMMDAMERENGAVTMMMYSEGNIFVDVRAIGIG